MKSQIISFHCVLKDSLGKVLSSSFNHDVLAQISEKAILPSSVAIDPSNPAASASHLDFHEPLQGLVEGLQGLKKGERRTIRVTAERAYGLYDPELVMQVARRRLPHGEALEIGYQVMTQAKDGECRIFRVTEADAATVTLDGNHPLAGQDLCFDIEATSAREATNEELKRGDASAQPARLQWH